MDTYQRGFNKMPKVDEKKEKLHSNKPPSSRELLVEKSKKIYETPLLELICRAQEIHKSHHKLGEVQKSTLLSIRTGACKEDCTYCAQSIHYKTGLKPEPLMKKEEVLQRANEAKKQGSSRFCMGLSGREIKNDKTFASVLEMIGEVKALGLETCLTMGMADENQANQLKKAGLDYYNHNIDTSRNHYKKVITTRSFDQRLDTIKNVRKAGMRVCTGGILGLGESRQDRIEFVAELAAMNPNPESLTINRLVPIKGTPLEKVKPVDDLEIVRTIATLRILCPSSVIRLSAGRETMSQTMQALCFLCGANSIFSGEKLLTTGNQSLSADQAMFEKIGLSSKPL